MTKETKDTKDFSELYAKVTDQIIKEMENGVIPWKKGWKAISGAYNAKSKKYYAFINQIALGKPGAYASFKQWKELNCKIKKGAKASYVIEWFFKDYKFDKTEKDEDGNEIEKEYKFRKWFPRVYPVFHESQVEGYTAPDMEEIEKPDPIDAAEKVIEEYKRFSGIRKIITNEQSDRAYYAPFGDYIQVPMIEQYENANEYYSTLFHEITHSTGHSKRLDRGLDKIAGFGSDNYSKEELVAELGSAMCCTRLGIDTDGTMKNSAAYLQGWLKALRNDKSLLISAASYAEKATKYIFNDK